jgi:hypothetical protein
VRPSADISNGLSTGPTACEASDALSSSTNAFASFFLPLARATKPAVWGPCCGDGSRAPNGLRPLNSCCARPSQKLRKLKTALITVGVFRGSTLRTWTPLTLNTGSPGKVPPSPTPGMNDVKSLLKHTIEEVTLTVSNNTAEWRSSGLARRWKG